MKQKQQFITLTAVLLTVVFAAGFAGNVRALDVRGTILGAFDQSAADNNALSQKELVDLVKPAVVRVIQHIKGEGTIPAFDVDLKQLKIFLLPGQEPIKLPIDEYLTGSGFVASTDGYVVSNAHVISWQTVKLELIDQIAAAVILKRVSELNAQETDMISDDETALGNFAREMYRFLLEHSSFTLDKKITVLNPASTADTVKDLIAEGFPARVVSVNDDYWDDNRDVGIIKIEQDNLPTLNFAGSEGLASGTKIHVFGFPGSAEFNGKSLLESTFTQGVVSAIKDSDHKDFKIYQTDAKVSQGSSGGPMFNERGEVVGVVTFQTANSQRLGDNFAFAIPTEIISQSFEKGAIVPTAGKYASRFSRGIALLHERHCERALAEFKEAGKANENFNVSDRVKPYIDECNALIASGDSIDSWWDERWAWVLSLGYVAWAIIGGGVLLVVVLVFVIRLLMHRLRREEKELGRLETRLSKEEQASGHLPAQSLTPISTGASPAGVKAEPVRQDPLHLEKKTFSDKSAKFFPDSFAEADLAKAKKPGQSAPQPEDALRRYVADARAIGLAEEAIRSELKAAGWPEAEITSALKH